MSNLIKNSKSLIWLIPIFLMVVGIEDADKFYSDDFIFVKFIIMGFSIFFAHKEKGNWRWILGFVALLYNPIFPIPLDEDVWPEANLVAFLAYFSRIIWGVFKTIRDRRKK